MDLASAYAVLKDSVKNPETIIIVGRCQVEYKGRARSRLDSGDRIVFLKQDGTFLVHRPVGLNPVNWMPVDADRKTPQRYFAVSLEDHKLKVRAVRSTPPESVDVIFDKVYSVESMALKDEGEFTLHLSEEEMRAALIKQPDILEDGFRIIDFEKKVEPGFIDLYGIDRSDRVVVVEIKKNPADKAAALQLKRYIAALGMDEDKVRGIIAAPALTKSGQTTIELLGIEFKQIDPKRCLKVVEKEDLIGPRLHEWFTDGTLSR